MGAGGQSGPFLPKHLLLDRPLLTAVQAGSAEDPEVCQFRVVTPALLTKRSLVDRPLRAPNGFRAEAGGLSRPLPCGHTGLTT